MVLSSDHITGATGKTVTVTISKAGAAFAAPTGTVTEIANGLYAIALTIVDTNTVGDLAFHCTAAGCDPTDFIDAVTSGATASQSVAFSSSAVAICSNALLMIGDQTINTLNDDSDRARSAANLYPLVVSYVQSQHKWRSCTKRAVLNPDSTAPLFDWNFQYTMPGDLLTINRVGRKEDVPIDYEYESEKILADETPIYLVYTFYNTNEATWSQYLTYCVTMCMARALAYPQTQAESLAGLLESTLRPLLVRAHHVDSSDAPPEVFGDYALQRARASSSSWAWRGW
jgi:hypothetical protein